MTIWKKKDDHRSWIIDIGLVVAVAVLLVAAVVYANYGKSQNDMDLDDFAQLDQRGTPIQCAIMIDLNQHDAMIHGESAVRPFKMWADDNGYQFQQCHADIERDRAEQCAAYGQAVRAVMRHQDASLLVWFQRGSLPGKWKSMCGHEIQDAVRGQNERYSILPGHVLSLDDRGQRWVVDRTSALSLNAKDADVHLWRVVIGDEDDGTNLWFSDPAVAQKAYDDLTKLLEAQN